MGKCGGNLVQKKLMLLWLAHEVPYVSLTECQRLRSILFVEPVTDSALQLGSIKDAFAFWFWNCDHSSYVKGARGIACLP